MKFLFVIHYPVYGGPHNQAIRLHGALASHGWSQIVLQPDDPANGPERLRANGVEVIQIPLHRVRESRDPRVHLGFGCSVLPEINNIRRIIRERQIDLVVPTGLVNPHAAIAAACEDTPVAWQLLDTRPPMMLRRAMMPFVSRLADVVMSTGMNVARLHPGATDFDDRLFTFFPPVDTMIFKPDHAVRLLARSELGLRADDIVVGNVSNLNPQKGHGTFIHAAAALRRLHPHVRFVILGATYEHHSAYANSLWAEAAELGLLVGQDLIVCDPGQRVAELAQALDIFWLTSEPRSEGIPTVVEEAMALAIPVIAVEVGSIREAIDDTVTGYVVSAFDTAAIVEKTALLINHASLRQRLGNAARERAIERFGIGACTETHLRAFEAAVDHCRANSGDARRKRWV